MKILHLDIETAPHQVFSWGLWKQTISINQIAIPGRTICFAAQWEGQKKVHFYSEHHHGQETMLEQAWKLLDEADVIVTYNGNHFDLPTLQKEFVMAGMAPPSTFRTVDLINTVRKQFRFASTKLDFVAQQLGLGSKTKHAGMDLWVGCMGGCESAWRKMKQYNRQDVVLLSKLYRALLPWVKNHPSWAPYLDGDRPSCRNCGSEHVIKKGVERTNSGTYVRYRCADCNTPLRAATGGKTRKNRTV